MSVELQSEVETWFARAQNSQMLRDFLADVRTRCEAIEEALGPAVVRAVYSRGDKQENGEIFKSFPKIAIALAKQRRSRPDASILTVEDIIGLTIVVYYPDEVALVLERLRAHAGLHVEVVKDAPKITNGYYAHHVVMRSNDPRHYNAHCEVQIKTMMHDAWAAKMHDLVYKPQGHTDKRLSTMMNVFGEALQSIETQSELLRNLIHERWNAEVKRRRGVRRTLCAEIQRIRRAFSPQADTIYRAMHAESLAHKPELGEIAAKIAQHARTAPLEAVWLALCLAMASADPVHAAFARRMANDFVVQAARNDEAALEQEEIWCIALGLSACGDLEGAISISEYILESFTTLQPTERGMVQFNLANFLVEQAAFEPTDPDPAALRARVNTLLAECDHIERADPSAFHDIRGMLEVAASTDPAVIRRAIGLIERGLHEAAPADREIAEIYFELHMRLAWRRLLELEAETADQPLPPALPPLEADPVPRPDSTSAPLPAPPAAAV
jgi:ppGpp synthetase/RelA/SpoT-type nucleotidyltranferase